MKAEDLVILKNLEEISRQIRNSKDLLNNFNKIFILKFEGGYDKNNFMSTIVDPNLMEPHVKEFISKVKEPYLKTLRELEEELEHQFAKYSLIDNETKE